MTKLIKQCSECGKEFITELKFKETTPHKGCHARPCPKKKEAKK